MYTCYLKIIETVSSACETLYFLFFSCAEKCIYIIYKIVYAHARTIPRLFVTNLRMSGKNSLKERESCQQLHFRHYTRK